MLVSVNVLADGRIAFVNSGGVDYDSIVCRLHPAVRGTQEKLERQGTEMVGPRAQNETILPECICNSLP